MPRKKQYQWKISDEAEGIDSLTPSRSEKKRQSLALQNMGEELTRLGPQEVKNLDLPADLREALQLYARIGDHEGRRRQMQFIGRVMREIDPAPIRAMLDARREVSAAATAALHKAEQWREEERMKDPVYRNLANGVWTYMSSDPKDPHKLCAATFWTISSW